MKIPGWKLHEHFLFGSVLISHLLWLIFLTFKYPGKGRGGLSHLPLYFISLTFFLFSILYLVLGSLFDESAKVREVMGRVVARLFDLQYPICPSQGARLILFGLSTFLQQPTEWLTELFQSLLNTITERAVTLAKCRAM